MYYAPQAEIQCLAQTIHGEAQGESLQGKKAVAQVIINRTRSPKYPKTVCGVVRQRHQFSGYRHSIHPSQICYKIAEEMLSSGTSIHNYLFFNTVGPSRAFRIGAHLFWK